MFDKLKELWEMKSKAEELKRQLESLKFSTEDEYSIITVKGTMEVESITIKCDVNSSNKNKVEKSITENINKAIRNAQMESAKRMLSNS
ncbi:MAG: YbaB/EbfC family nucleoid-associated protein [Elusimicrobiales bacterium]|nr:YbaB/EbfC family nucleoid-associated protein [Elusimicrobiales bacterium]